MTSTRNEKDQIIHQIFKINASIARRKRILATAKCEGSTAYAQVVQRGIALDEKRVTDLGVRLADWT